MSIILIENLNKNFGTKEVLKDMDLSLESGQIVGLVGPNGSGKTTLLKILAGLTSDYTGNVRIDGKPLGVETKAMVSYLPEKTYLSDWMRCVDAIDCFNDFYSDFDRNKAMEMLVQLRLDPKQRIKTMSKGMQEKLQLTLVMGRQARVYLLDEPIGGVDPATRSVILDAVLKQYSEDSLMVFATHLIADVERIFDRVIFLGFGEIKLHEEVDKIREKYGKSVDEVFREVFSCLVSL
ncbi:MAG: ABC transporter ATP-binding protein [Oscillospiraceae bacterium]|nr:ABC transporter ATP-binding protein [Oscillospiraceae bacterium]